MMGFGMGGIVMVVVTIALIGLGVLLVAALFPRITGSNTTSNTSPRVEAPQSAVDILKQRYARGEISKEQFEQMKRDVEA
ncbi:MAG: SHOCT domain-containing protein [Chloroflexi bacterium]|nr:SHOCT domain-containing protein [Chloroflexota bacterium]MCL5274814.1 SHOCT domain-containing protein [Chloroflexota bacterium]